MITNRTQAGEHPESHEFVRILVSLCVLAIFLTLIGLIFSYINVSTTRVKFNLEVNELSFTTMENWNKAGEISGLPQIGKGSLCSEPSDSDDKAPPRYKGISLSGEIPKGSLVYLTHINKHFSLHLKMPGECNGRQVHAYLASEDPTKTKALEFNNVFHMQAAARDTRPTEYLPHIRQGKMFAEPLVVKSAFQPVYVSDIKFKNARETLNDKSRPQTASTAAESAVTHFSRIKAGRIEFTEYAGSIEPVTIKQGDLLEVVFDRAHILSLSSNEDGISLRGFAELSAINALDYVFEEDTSGQINKQSLMPSWREKMIASKLFVIGSSALAAAVAFFGLLELWGIRVFVSNQSANGRSRRKKLS